jgi:hypothetical protein
MAFSSPSTPAKPNADNIMATLRMLRDDELLQYAQLHKNDPYIFPLTFQESNSRKQVRAKQSAQAAPTTKVVDQNLQEMAAPAPQMAQGMPQQGMPQQGMPPQQLPEDVGIGQLPAPNMQRMATGGIVAFDEGGEVPPGDPGAQMVGLHHPHPHTHSSMSHHSPQHQPAPPEPAPAPQPLLVPWVSPWGRGNAERARIERGWQSHLPWPGV